jgi:hypothetical protein
MRDSHRDGGYIKHKTIKIYMSLLVNLKIRPQGSTVRVGTIIFEKLRCPPRVQERSRAARCSLKALREAEMFD